jgi:hypothetical protein
VGLLEAQGAGFLTGSGMSEAELLAAISEAAREADAAVERDGNKVDTRKWSPELRAWLGKD